MQTHGCTWVHTRILKKSRYMGTCKNLEKIQDTYTNFDKIQQKQSFHHQSTTVYCIKSRLVITESIISKFIFSPIKIHSR